MLTKENVLEIILRALQNLNDELPTTKSSKPARTRRCSAPTPRWIRWRWCR
jgi:hypothetical protein